MRESTRGGVIDILLERTDDYKQILMEYLYFYRDLNYLSANK